MTEPQIIQRVSLEPQHRPTGKTRHFRGTQPIPSPVELRIVQYHNDPGLYHFYCNASGMELTDTYHASLEGAMAQAAWEFNVVEADWQSGGGE